MAARIAHTPPPADPDWDRRTRASFAAQPFMAHLGATLTLVEPGRVSIAVDRRDALTQQHAFLHAGVLATIADTAAGFAALTLVPADRDILTAEFKINLLRPGTGARFEADAHVVRAGRSLTVSRVDVSGDDLCAIATVTLACVQTPR